jgi:uncharacterized membrane protein YfcA
MSSTERVTLLPFVEAGMAVGLFYGWFGAGGSAFATPVLAMLGLPGVVAVATPLPALLPASLAGLASYRGGHDLDWTAARRTLTGAIPAALLGTACSKVVDGRSLLVFSAGTLVLVGVGMVWLPRRAGGRGPSPTAAGVSVRRSLRRTNVATVVLGGAAIGFLTGLLANGGGFLLVPFFAMALEMPMRQAAGTSLVTAAVLALPTTAAHALAGNINWTVAAAFAAGLVPAALAGGHIGRHLGGTASRVAFGVTLIAFAGWFLARLIG